MIISHEVGGDFVGISINKIPDNHLFLVTCFFFFYDFVNFLRYFFEFSENLASKRNETRGNLGIHASMLHRVLIYFLLL